MWAEEYSNRNEKYSWGENNWLDDIEKCVNYLEDRVMELIQNVQKKEKQMIVWGPSWDDIKDLTLTL